MKIDETKSDAARTTCEGDRQNRREFFNGLGKWSMIVVAAVSFLRGSATGSQASREDPPNLEQEPQRPAWAVADDSNQRQRMASYFKQRHINTHGNEKHLNETEHWNQAKIQ